MPHSPSFLNDRQLQVLAWVVAGCPEGSFPPGDYAHRITARALESRGLLTVTGRGATWSAEATDDGVTRLAAEQSAERVQERALTAGAQLIADVLSAGGSLDVSGTVAPRTDWDALVRNANQSKIRPSGQWLTREAGAGSGRTILRFKPNYWELTEKPDVPVPSRLRTPHTAVRKYAEDVDWHYVSKSLVPRATRVLEALARAGERIGMEVRAGQPWWNPPRTWQQSRQVASHLDVRHEGHSSRIVIREMKGEGSVRRDPIRRPNSRLPQWQEMQHYTFVPSGRLEVEVDGPGLSPLVVRDTRSQTLESQLGRVLQAIEVGALEARDLAKVVAERESLARERWESAIAQAEAAWELEQRVDLLTQRAEEWERRDRVARYVTALELLPHLEADDARWLDWAQHWLRSTSTPLPGRAFKLPAPRRDELQRHLRGWSAYGPSAAPPGPAFPSQSGG